MSRTPKVNHKVGKVKSPKVAVMKNKKVGSLKPMKPMKFSSKSAAKRSSNKY